MEGMSLTEYSPDTHAGALTTQDLHRLLEEVAAAWLASKPSYRTREAYWRDLSTFGAWLTANRAGHLLKVSRPHLDAFARYLESRVPSYAPSTRARILSSLSSFYEYACEAGVLRVNPAAHVKRPKLANYSPRLGLNLDTAPKVIEAAHRLTAEHRALVALCLFAGLRVSEALSVEGRDIRQEAGHTVLEVTSKGGARDIVPLSAPALRLLSEVLEARGSEGKLLAGVDRFRAYRMVEALGREAGLGRKLSPHDLRHGAATCAREAGVGLEEVRDLLRHASVTTTQRYDHARRRLDTSAAYGLASALGGAA